jgi:EAL and modified HD-GYP domain-containing signal transduction protein
MTASAQSVLGGLAMGYQLIWSPQRKVCAVQLFIGTEPGELQPVDAQHLLTVIAQSWSAQSPRLILAANSVDLLQDLLAHAPTNAPDSAPWLAVHSSLLGEDPTLAQHVHRAHQRGVPLIWRGEPGERPPAALSACFAKLMLTLTTDEALHGLRLSLKKTGKTGQISPVEKGEIYDGLASWVLTEHCLDQQGAWAVAGWPMEDVVHGYRHQRMQPAHSTIMQLMKAVDTDQSVEAIEHILSEEPILAYRFMRYINSVGLGLRTEVESIRHGLLVLGYSLFQTWLVEQLPHATSDLNLQPVRTALVIRARLMDQLLDAGDGDDLRREVYLCGLLSQIDLLLGEPLSTALQRFPLPERIVAAILNNDGPYSPYLEVATALESPSTHVTHTLCETHELAFEDVNRALLRTLANIR